jgi:hypothetical protein
MWFLRGKVLLTKDNLVKHKWKGCIKYCFCDLSEIVQHLFISCPFVRIIWRKVYFTYKLPPPTKITNMFGNWLNGVPKNATARIRIGVSALCWSIWTCQNNIIFNTQKNSIFFYRLFGWCALDLYMVLPPSGGSAGAYGYWMQSAVNGCSGLLFLDY